MPHYYGHIRHLLKWCSGYQVTNIWALGFSGCSYLLITLNPARLKKVSLWLCGWLLAASPYDLYPQYTHTIPHEISYNVLFSLYNSTNSYGIEEPIWRHGSSYYKQFCKRSKRIINCINRLRAFSCFVVWIRPNMTQFLRALGLS